MYSKMICLYIYMHVYIIFIFYYDLLYWIYITEYTIYPVVYRRTFLFTNSMYNSLHCSPYSQFIAPAPLTTASLLYLWVCFFELNFLNHVFIFSCIGVVKKTPWVFLIIILIHIIVWYPVWQCGFLYWYDRFFSMFLWAWCGRNKCLCEPC